MADGFGHRDEYWMAYRGHQLVGVLPLFVVSSRIAGRLAVSVPYGVAGGILAADPEAAAVMLGRAVRIADHSNSRMLDLRSARPMFRHLDTVDRYVGFRRELPDRPADVLPWLPRKARAAARNGRNKFGLQVLHAEQHLPAVWKLYCRNMRRLGSLNYPLRFFDAMMRHLPAAVWVTLVKWNGIPVSGLVTLVFGECVMPYFYGATDAARRCSAANLTYLTVMERAVAAGYRVFDFGRSRRSNKGSVAFKRFHGFEPRPLGYQHDIRPGQTAVDLDPDHPRYMIARRLWRYLPLPLTRAVGAYVSRHVPG